MSIVSKVLTAYFKRRLHALGSKRHWKKDFNKGNLISRETLENATKNSREKFVRWAMANGGAHDCACDGIRMRKLSEL